MGEKTLKQFAVIFAVLGCVLLSACGGGGGGGVSVAPPGGENPEPPALTEPELRSLAARVAEKISEPPRLPKNLEEQFMVEIAGLQSAISSPQSAKAELERQIKELRDRVEDEKNRIAESSCDIAGQIRNNSGVCEYPPCGAGEERINGDCVATCESGQIRNNNGVCEYPSCGAGKVIDGVCDAPCSAGEERQNGVCVDARCGLGKISKFNQCFPLTDRDCRLKNKILVGNACRSCPAATPRIVDNRCMRELTVADCNREDKIRISVDGKYFCRSCIDPAPTRVGNMCQLRPPTIDECHEIDQVWATVNNRPYCYVCGGNKPIRMGNVCVPSAEVCHSQGKILVDNNCYSCPGAKPYRDKNQCVQQSPYSTPPTVASCNKEDKIFVDNECRPCAGARPLRAGNQCQSILDRFLGFRSQELRGTLSPEFAHMKARFSAVEIAVNHTNGLYHNMPLSQMFSVAPGRVSQPLGDAALKLLSSPPVVEENTPSGFFAFGDIDGEMGVRWRGKTGAFGFLPSGANMLAEASHVVSDGALSGASFGALGTASGSSNGGKFRLGGRLLGGLSAFGEYEYRDISAGISGALLDSRIRGAESSGWSAGLEYGFGGGERLRISASRRTELSGGELVLRYPKAVGADLGRVLMEEEAALPLSRHVPLLWSLGYVVSGSGKSEWSAALEYDEGADDGAISAAWWLEF